MTIKDVSIYVSNRDSVVADKGHPITQPNLTFTAQAGRVEKIDRWRNGTPMPKWRQVIQNGGNATTPMTASYRSYVECRPQSLFTSYKDQFQGNKVFKMTSSGYCTARVMGGTWPSWGAFTDNANAQASNRFLNAVRQAQVKVSGPTFVGEIRETLRMLHKPAAGLQDLINLYLSAATARYDAMGRPKWPKPPKPKPRKPGQNNASGYYARQKEAGKYSHANSLAAWESALAELWLEHAFGWRPLMMDIQGAIEAYFAMFDVDRIEHISAGGKDFFKKADTVFTTSFSDVGTWTRYDIRYWTEQTSIVRYKGAYKARAATTAGERAARWGFTPSEFIPTAWELLPWSFLIDYFATIGDYLQSTVTDTGSVIWCNKTAIQIADLVCVDVPNKPTPALLSASDAYVLSTGSLVKRSRDITRSVGVLPTPGLQVRWKQGVWRLANMLALFQGVSKGNPQYLSGRNFRL